MRSHAFRLRREGKWVPLTSETSLVQLRFLPCENLGFVYGYPSDNCWEHNIEVLSLHDLPKLLADYVPTCTSVEYASPEEEIKGLSELKARWAEFSNERVSSLAVLDDSLG